MAIRLVFVARMRGLFMIVIRGKEVFYNDKKSGVHMLYPELSTEARRLFGKHNEQELKEYGMCKTEQELMAFVIRDCSRLGAKLVKKEEIK